MTFTSTIFCAVICISTAYATSDFRDKEGIDECFEKFGLSMTEKEFSEKNDISSVDPCFWACNFKAIGFLNSEGQYNPEIAHSYYNREELSPLGTARLDKLDQIIAKCDAALEKITGTDDKAECDRGFQLAKCYVEDVKDIFLDDSRK